MLLGPVRIRHAIMKGVAKLRTVGRTRPADQFNPARQIACTFFQAPHFATVDSSETALSAASLVELSAAAAFSCKQLYKGVRNGMILLLLLCCITF